MLQRELVAASAEPLILSLLSRGESYGYAISLEIKERSEDRIRWADGMLYPVLHRLERHGWIESRWRESESGRKRKYYTITQEGRKTLKKQSEQWTMVHAVLTQIWKEQYV